MEQEKEKSIVLRAAEWTIEQVIAERGRQDEKWGEQNHDFPMYLTILMEEIGEASQAWLEWHFHKGDQEAFLKEIIQMAAVALAIVECEKRANLRTEEV